MPSEIEKSRNVKSTHELLGDIVVAFQQRPGISEADVKKVHRELNGKIKEGVFLPGKQSTWDQIIFLGNARKYADLPKSKDSEKSKVTKRHIDRGAEVARRILDPRSNPSGYSAAYLPGRRLDPFSSEYPQRGGTAVAFRRRDQHT